MQSHRSSPDISSTSSFLFFSGETPSHTMARSPLKKQRPTAAHCLLAGIHSLTSCPRTVPRHVPHGAHFTRHPSRAHGSLRSKPPRPRIYSPKDTTQRGRVHKKHDGASRVRVRVRQVPPPLPPFFWKKPETGVTAVFYDPADAGQGRIEGQRGRESGEGEGEGEGWEGL